MNHQLIASALLIFLTTPFVFAGGSVPFAETRKILEQEPSLARFVHDTLDIHESGWATRLGARFEHLSGARVGPYSFEARPKGMQGYSLEMTVCTKVTWRNGRGMKTDHKFEASSFKESFDGLVVRRAGSAGQSPCRRPA